MPHFDDLYFGEFDGFQTKFDMGIQELRVVDLARRKCLDYLERLPENAFLLPRTFMQLKIYRLQLNGFLRGEKNENIFKKKVDAIEKSFNDCNQQVKDEYAFARNVYRRCFKVRGPSQEIVDKLLEIYQQISLLKDYTGAGMRLEKQFTGRQAFKKASE